MPSRLRVAAIWEAPRSAKVVMFVMFLGVVVGTAIASPDLPSLSFKALLQDCGDDAQCAGDGAIQCRGDFEYCGTPPPPPPNGTFSWPVYDEAGNPALDGSCLALPGDPKAKGDGTIRHGVCTGTAAGVRTSFQAYVCVPATERCPLWGRATYSINPGAHVDIPPLERYNPSFLSTPVRSEDGTVAVAIVNVRHAGPELELACETIGESGAKAMRRGDTAPGSPGSVTLTCPLSAAAREANVLLYQKFSPHEEMVAAARLSPRGA